MPANHEPPAWMVAEVAAGLQRLYALRLPYSPESGLLLEIGRLWCDALLALPVTWSRDPDRERLRVGFGRLLPVVDRWPVPRQLIDRLPPRPERLKLSPPEPSAADRERLAAMLKGLSGKLRRGA